MGVLPRTLAIGAETENTERPNFKGIPWAMMATEAKWQSERQVDVAKSSVKAVMHHRENSKE